VNRTVIALCLALAACDAPPGVSADKPAFATTIDQPITHKQLRGDIIRIDLHIDLAQKSAHALYRVRTDGAQIDLEVDGLTITDTRSMDGEPLAATVTKLGTHQILTLEALPGLNVFAIDYSFTDDTQNGMQRGLSLARQNTLLWPDGCSALYPCHSDPEDGITFSLDVANLPPGAMGLYPREVNAPAPSYMLAFAYGDYVAYDAGRTSSGTQIRAYVSKHRGTPAGYAAHLQDLRAQFDWLERTIGPYAYGDEVGTIVVPNGFGGMEHHPVWYVENVDSDAHEAAHGWFGNGVRIKCWEDLVLSEGITEYLSLRVRRALAGFDDGYAAYLASSEGPKPQPGNNGAWYPDTCDVRSAYDALGTVYAQGSGFMMELATLHGETALDGVISEFYRTHRGGAWRMQDFLDFVAQRSSVDVEQLAAKWLL
jgi:hypothetical protein